MIIIWGTKQEAIYTKNSILKSQNDLSSTLKYTDNQNYCQEKNLFVTDNKILGFADNNSALWDTILDGYNVFNPYEVLKNQSVDTIIISIRNGDSIYSIIDQIKEGMTHKIRIGILKLSSSDFHEIVDKNFLYEKILWLDTLKKPLFTYLQCVLLTSCNLNCKGCTHFANLFNENKHQNYYDIDRLENDINVIAEHSEVLRFRLLGGEPLLYPKLKQAVIVSRKSLPETDIRIVTNGLLINRASPDLLKCFHDNRIGIDISPYLPIMKSINQIVDKLNEYDINYYFVGDKKQGITEFAKNIDFNHDTDPFEAMAHCISRECRTLYQGKIYKCPIDPLIMEFYQYFGMKANVCSSGFDVNANNVGWREMITELYKKPVNFCKYCSLQKSNFKWDQTIEPQKKDWLLEQ